MNTLLFPLHPELLASSRVGGWAAPADRVRWLEVTILMSAGVAAALAVSLLDFGLRLPGHAILRAVFPMALGLSLAPRRLGGMVMGGSAAATVLLLQGLGHRGPGTGAMTSLCLTGPLLDAALWRTRSGWPLYLSFGLAGCLANMAAFAVRGAGKMSGLEPLTKRPLADWVTTAAWSYALCGLVAGLLSAAIWFRLRAADSPARGEGSWQ